MAKKNKNEVNESEVSSTEVEVEATAPVEVVEETPKAKAEAVVAKHTHSSACESQTVALVEQISRIFVDGSKNEHAKEIAKIYVTKEELHAALEKLEEKLINMIRKV